MYSRFAYLLGGVDENDRAQFNHDLETQVLSLIRSMPGVAQAHFHFTDVADSGAPDIYAVLTITYASQEDMELALASPIRGEMQSQFRALLPKFKGSIVHINSDMR